MKRSMILWSLLFGSFALNGICGFVTPTKKINRRSSLFSQTTEKEVVSAKTVPTVPYNRNPTDFVSAGLSVEESRQGYETANTLIRDLEPTLQQRIKETILNSPLLRFDPFHIHGKSLLTQRAYARSEPFKQENIQNPPEFEDLLPDQTELSDIFYFTVPGIALTFFVSCAVFPPLSQIMISYIHVPPTMLNDIADKFLPGVAILYGTFISVTLSMLYDRQRNVQGSIARETSLLSVLLHQMVSLFRRDRDRTVRAAQCAADQIRLLLGDTRASELMNIIYSDPYTRMLELIEEEEERLVQEHGDFLSKGPVLNSCRDLIKDLRTTRAGRLSEEAMALPETHFFVLKALTSLLLVGYFISVLPTVEELGSVPVESTFIFGALSTVYILFYSIANDLNGIYQGVFQLRRGIPASHLAEVKQIVANHPWLKSEISFERVNKEAKSHLPRSIDAFLGNNITLKGTL